MYKMYVALCLDQQIMLLFFIRIYSIHSFILRRVIEERDERITDYFDQCHVKLSSA